VRRLGQNRIEWALLGVIALVCDVLSFLQYRWTGELSRAGLNEQLQRLSQTFNHDLRENCTMLLPDAKEIW